MKIINRVGMKRNIIHVSPGDQPIVKSSKVSHKYSLGINAGNIVLTKSEDNGAHVVDTASFPISSMCGLNGMNYPAGTLVDTIHTEQYGLNDLDMNKDGTAFNTLSGLGFTGISSLFSLHAQKISGQQGSQLNQFEKKAKEMMDDSTHRLNPQKTTPTFPTLHGYFKSYEFYENVMLAAKLPYLTMNAWNSDLRNDKGLNLEPKVAEAFYALWESGTGIHRIIKKHTEAFTGNASLVTGGAAGPVRVQAPELLISGASFLDPLKKPGQCIFPEVGSCIELTPEVLRLFGFDKCYIKITTLELPNGNNQNYGKYKFEIYIGIFQGVQYKIVDNSENVRENGCWVQRAPVPNFPNDDASRRSGDWRPLNFNFDDINRGNTVNATIMAGPDEDKKRLCVVMKEWGDKLQVIVYKIIRMSNRGIQCSGQAGGAASQEQAVAAAPQEQAVAAVAPAQMARQFNSSTMVTVDMVVTWLCMAILENIIYTGPISPERAGLLRPAYTKDSPFVWTDNGKSDTEKFYTALVFKSQPPYPYESEITRMRTQIKSFMEYNTYIVGDVLSITPNIRTYVYVDSSEGLKLDVSIRQGLIDDCTRINEIAQGVVAVLTDEIQQLQVRAQHLRLPITDEDAIHGSYKTLAKKVDTCVRALSIVSPIKVNKNNKHSAQSIRYYTAITSISPAELHTILTDRQIRDIKSRENFDRCVINFLEGKPSDTQQEAKAEISETTFLVAFNKMRLYIEKLAKQTGRRGGSGASTKDRSRSRSDDDERLKSMSPLDDDIKYARTISPDDTFTSESHNISFATITPEKKERRSRSSSGERVSGRRGSRSRSRSRSSSNGENRGRREREPFTRRSVDKDITEIIPEKEVNLTGELCDSFEKSFNKLWEEITRQPQQQRIDKFKTLFKNTFFNLLLREDALHGYGHVNVTIDTLKDIIKWYLMNETDLTNLRSAVGDLHQTYISVMVSQVLPLLNQPFKRTDSGELRTLFSMASNQYANFTRNSPSPPPPTPATTSEQNRFRFRSFQSSPAHTGPIVNVAASSASSQSPPPLSRKGGADISTHKSKKRNFKNSHNNRTRKYRERKQKTTRTNRPQHPSQNKRKTIRNNM